MGGRVKILVLGACQGERSLADLLESQAGHRPPVIVFAQGEFAIPSRAVHLFIEGFCRSLAEGRASTDAFLKGVDRVRWDDDIGEVAHRTEWLIALTDPMANTQCPPPSSASGSATCKR